MSCILIADLETDGFDPSRIWVVGILDYATGVYTSYHDDNIVEGLIRLAEADLVVGHNFKRFDAVQIRKLTDGLIEIPNNRIYDTYEKSSKIFGKHVKKHGLRAWGELFEFEKGDHTDFSRLSPEMIVYCERDVRITAKLFDLLLEAEGILGAERQILTEAT